MRVKAHWLPFSGGKKDLGGRSIETYWKGHEALALSPEMGVQTALFRAHIDTRGVCGCLAQLFGLEGRIDDDFPAVIFSSGKV